MAVWFPFLPGRWTHKVIDTRVPVLGEFFMKNHTVYKCANGYKDQTPRDIVIPLERGNV